MTVLTFGNSYPGTDTRGACVITERTIADVINEFNNNNFPNLRCEVQDEGAETPIYVVENRNCLKVAEMQEGMIEIFRYKVFTPDFMVTVGNLFKEIFEIEEVENES